jgi:hypothetical protein
MDPSLAAMGSQAPPQLLNIDGFLNVQSTGPTAALPNSFIDSQPLVNLQQPNLNRMPSLAGKNLADLDYKRPKIDVYMQNDLFTQCANPLEFEALR